MKNILVIGGAGYIGRQIVKILNKKKYNIHVIDNLSITKTNYLNKSTKFSKIDILNKKKLRKFFKNKKINLIIHLAALCVVSEGEKLKKKYYKNNVIGTKNLIECCKKFKINNFIFSSSCCVFSNKLKKVNENSAKNPMNYYGKTKLACENLIKEKFKNTNIKYIILRYFNVVGANIKDKVGEFNNKDRLFNNFAQKILNNNNLTIYGKNYKTFDGTCIRDFIHVYDLAQIHVSCINKFKLLKKFTVLNCGYGKGYSILQVAKIFQKFKKNKIKIEFTNRRTGDMEQITTSNHKLIKFIKWKPKYNNINKMVLSTYNWMKHISKKTI